MENFTSFGGLLARSVYTVHLSDFARRCLLCDIMIPLHALFDIKHAGGVLEFS